MARMQGGNALVHGKPGLDWYELRRAGRGCGELRVRVRVRVRGRVRVRVRIRLRLADLRCVDDRARARRAVLLGEHAPVGVQRKEPAWASSR